MDNATTTPAREPAKTKLTEEELLALGWTLTAGGTLWRCPRNWRHWQPIETTPDWWDDTDGSGAMEVGRVPEGVDVFTDPRFAVSAGLVWPVTKR
jgi:hypothetical protein